MSRSLFTSESVSMGHPDKMCDQISDAVLDAMLEQDPPRGWPVRRSRPPAFIVLAGEITTRTRVDYQHLVRAVVRDIGYTDSAMGFDADLRRAGRGRATVARTSPRGVGRARGCTRSRAPATRA
jgi:S-adenosylmethionine synthetase